MKVIATMTRVASAGALFVALGPSAALASCSDLNGGIKAGVDCANPNENSTLNIGDIFHTVANTLIFIVGAIAVIMLIVGGLRYVTSGGNATGVEAAKNTILYAVIGIVVAVAAFAIVNFVLNRLGVT